MTELAPRTLANEVTDAFRLIIASALAMVVVVVASLSWFVFVGDPSIDRSARLVGLSQDVQADLFEQAYLLRAYVITGDASVLDNYPAARATTLADIDALRHSVSRGRSARLVARLVDADSVWQNQWASQAVLPQTRARIVSSDGNLDADKLSAFIQRGQVTLEAAETAAMNAHAAGVAAHNRSRIETVAVISGTAALLLIIALVAAIASTRRRRRLDARVVGPIGVLLAKVRSVSNGEFGPAPVIDAPLELLELRDELANMSASLEVQQEALEARADEAADNARRLKLVVDFAREIADSMTLSNVLAAVTSASRRLLTSQRVRVWLVEPDDALTLRLRSDSITGDAVPDLTHPVGSGGLGRAAQEHRMCYADALTGDSSTASSETLVVAVPLLKGTRVIGVLEIALARGEAELDPATVDVLEVTADHAATAIDGALLYELAESLARSDPLTGLGNRRQLDQDLALEVERSGRYQRPLTFLMIDIDHFKQVNDTFGHAVGDGVLREVAALLRTEMRAGDTAYRFGGEEFAVLARETDVAGGAAVAERLRAAIEKKYAPRVDGDLSVTVSIGVAALRFAAEDGAELMGSADAMLYEAKRLGRNRVQGAKTGGPVDGKIGRFAVVR
ncbi:MAG TPA: diguanylate cyclase [Mycobacteriales bacterium]|nr:diguanylate cyclase [Mycobacteriales bacterium]